MPLLWGKMTEAGRQGRVQVKISNHKEETIIEGHERETTNAIILTYDVDSNRVVREAVKIAMVRNKTNLHSG